MSETVLENCPFCGGAAEIRDTNFYYMKAIRVRCTDCHVTTSPVPIDHPALTCTGIDESTRYTREQATEIAIQNGIGGLDILRRRNRMSTVSVSHMRRKLKSAPKYNYTDSARTTWSTKVDRMPDRQIIAIYFRMLHAGEL